MTKRKTAFTINGKPSSLKEIRDTAKENFLHNALGDYILSREAYRAGVSPSTLRSWRGSGRLRAKKVGTTWFYHRQDLLKLIEKRNRKTYPITIDGKPTKRRDIRSVVLDTILKEALGDCLSASDVRNKAGIKESTLRKWRRSARLRAKKIRNSWYYSRQDLLELIKTEGHTPPSLGRPPTKT
jgi:DNA-binding transcriptional MerR regulator